MARIPPPALPTPAGYHYDARAPRTPAEMLNHMAPATDQTRLGDTLVDVITAVNQLAADVLLIRQGYGNMLANLTAANGTLSNAGNLTAKYGPGNLTNGIGNITIGTGVQGSVTIQPLGGR